ncbi:MAG: 7TM diverse intracellular signaling domain-containing protein, partial [Flavobacteriales bacterium]
AIDQEVPNLAATSNTYWFYLAETELEPDAGVSVLELAYPTLDDVVVYKCNNQGVIDSLLFGERVPYETRKYKHHNYIFDFIPGTNYLIRIRSDDQIMFPVYHGSYQAIMEKNGSKDVINGLYFGIMLVMFLYNLFVYFSTRDKAYLLYVAYLLSVGFMQAIFQGYAFRFVWPSSPWIAQTSVYVFSCLVPITAMWFTQVFIRTKENSKVLHYGFVLFMCLYVIAAVLGVLGFHIQSQLFIQAISASAIYTLIAGVIIARKGRREAKFFVIAWAIFLGSVVVWFMKDFGVLPYNDLTNHALQIGSAIEVILLSFALADRINLLKKEKESEQIARIQAIQENERIVTEQNIILESKVEARTKELETSNVELQTTLTDLQSAQSQLVDAEKMASLGQMTAGIAHELNNPINFVSSNVLPLKRDFEDVLEVLDK